MTARFQRQTAFRLWISDIINAQFVNPKQEFTPSYIITRELHVSRVNFISICIEKQITENFQNAAQVAGNYYRFHCHFVCFFGNCDEPPRNIFRC